MYINIELQTKDQPLPPASLRPWLLGVLLGLPPWSVHFWEAFSLICVNHLGKIDKIIPTWWMNQENSKISFSKLWVLGICLWLTWSTTAIWQLRAFLPPSCCRLSLVIWLVCFAIGTIWWSNFKKNNSKDGTSNKKSCNHSNCVNQLSFETAKKDANPQPTNYFLSTSQTTEPTCSGSGKTMVPDTW